MSYDINAKELNELEIERIEYKTKARFKYNPLLNSVSVSRFRAQLTKMELNTKIVK